MSDNDLRNCPRCGNDLPAEGFFPSAWERSGSWCRECQLEYYRQPKHKAYHKEYTARRRRENRDWLRELKEGLECEVCGESHRACLDFHHRDPAAKLFCLAQTTCRSRKQIIDEIAKCVVLCANCHRKLHYTGDDTQE